MVEGTGAFIKGRYRRDVFSAFVVLRRTHYVFILGMNSLESMRGVGILLHIVLFDGCTFSGLVLFMSHEPFDFGDGNVGRVRGYVCQGPVGCFKGRFVNVLFCPVVSVFLNLLIGQDFVGVYTMMVDVNL